MAVDYKIVCFPVLTLLYGRCVQMELSADELLKDKSISMKQSSTDRHDVATGVKQYWLEIYL